MGLHLYCFTPPGYGPGVDLAGLRAESVSCIPVPGLTAWVQVLESPPVAGVEAIRRHDAVVRDAWRRAPACLPARFGQWFAEQAVLEEKVEGMRPALERALARVAGAGEYGVRVLESPSPEESVPTTEAAPESAILPVKDPIPVADGLAAADPVAATGGLPATEPEPEAGRSSPGRAYMERLRLEARRKEARERQVEELARDLEAALGDAVRAQRLDPLPEGEGLVSVSHLVATDSQEAYGRRLGNFRERRPELGIVATGPWPPYSFAP